MLNMPFSFRSERVDNAWLGVDHAVNGLIRDITRDPYKNMGYATDSRMDQYIVSLKELQAAMVECAYQKLPLYWTTLDGRKLAIPDITDDHLQNIIRHLREHNFDRSDPVYLRMINEANSRGLKETITIAKEWT